MLKKFQFNPAYRLWGYAAIRTDVPWPLADIPLIPVGRSPVIIETLNNPQFANSQNLFKLLADILYPYSQINTTTHAFSILNLLDNSEFQPQKYLPFHQQSRVPAFPLFRKKNPVHQYNTDFQQRLPQSSQNPMKKTKPQ